MIFPVARNAVHRLVAVPRASAAASSSMRMLQTSAVRLAGSAPPVLQGEGAKPGEIPTDENQSTGLERFELMGRMQGVDVFDLKPLPSDRLGTTKEPIFVQSLYPTRIVGCTGSPAGSHDTTWIHMKKEHAHHRCPECGSVYKLDFIGDENTDGHHH